MDHPNRPTKDPYQEMPVKDFSYVNTNTNNKPPKKNNSLWYLIAGFVVVLVLVGAGIFIAKKYTHSNKTNKITNKQTTATKPSSTITSSKLASYTSTVFNFKVSYPNNWTVATQGNTSVSISSPETSLTADTGNKVNGMVVLSVFNKGQIPASFGSYSVAVLNSQDINFTKPTAAQAAQTYISFIQYPATTVKGGLDAIYVTGNNGFVKDDAITTAIVGQVDPLIVVNFEQCSSKDCSQVKNLTISSTMWSNTSFSTPILNILKSFSFS